MADLLTSDVLGTSQPYRTAQATVAELLRREVLSGRLQPGSRLTQAAVAEGMRTSTTPVREALRELAGEGLLDLDPHRGVVVHQRRPEELDEIYQVRMLLEPIAISETVKHITPDGIRAAERIMGQMERETDIAEWTILNAAFHSILAEASQLPIVSSILQKLRNISALYIASSLRPHPDRIVAGNGEHRALLAACEKHDVAAAVEVEIAHLRHTLEIGGDAAKLALEPPRSE